jgi:hypothetical protein
MKRRTLACLTACFVAAGSAHAAFGGMPGHELPSAVSPSSFAFAGLRGGLGALQSALPTTQSAYSANLSADSFGKTATLPAIAETGLSFLDTLSFRIDVPSAVVLTATGIDLHSLKLSVPALGGLQSLGGGAIVLDNGVLEPGTYLASLEGMSRAAMPGAYSFLATATPVAPIPEPEEWVLMLFGLGVVAWAVKGRGGQRAPAASTA